MPYKRRSRFWWTIFYPSVGTVFSKEEVFQQPLDFTPTIGGFPSVALTFSGACDFIFCPKYL
jgi:hypothetical protein